MLGVMRTANGIQLQAHVTDIVSFHSELLTEKIILLFILLYCPRLNNSGLYLDEQFIIQEMCQ